jgi:hypothetical protein
MQIRFGSCDPCVHLSMHVIYNMYTQWSHAGYMIAPAMFMCVHVCENAYEDAYLCDGVRNTCAALFFGQKLSLNCVIFQSKWSTFRNRARL